MFHLDFKHFINKSITKILNLIRPDYFVLKIALHSAIQLLHPVHFYGSQSLDKRMNVTISKIFRRMQYQMQIRKIYSNIDASDKCFENRLIIFCNLFTYLFFESLRIINALP